MTATKPNPTGSAHWTPAAGWHDCPTPNVVTTTTDGTTRFRRPGCPTDPHQTGGDPTIRAAWHNCAQDRTETLSGSLAAWDRPDAVTAADVAADIADRLRTCPGWGGEYVVTIRRAGQVTSTITGGRCDHRQEPPPAD